MKKAWPLVILLLAGLVSPGHSGTKGYLFVTGGGDRPESMMRRFVDLAGRFGSGKIIVFPMASSEPAETGASLVAEKPQLLGIGGDEETAIVVGPEEKFEVVGNWNVIVYDASHASVAIRPSRVIGLRGMIMHVLVAGGRFDLNKRKAVR